MEVETPALGGGGEGHAPDRFTKRRSKPSPECVSCPFPLDLYDRLRDDLLEGRAEEEYLQDAERIGPYLTLMGGRLYEQQNIRWCEAVLGILARRARGNAKIA
jgi:hypothetical protein